MYRKILVPLDGSKVAEGVLPHAKSLAYSEGAELILLTVGANPALDYAFSDPGLAQQAIQEQDRNMFRTRCYPCTRLQTLSFCKGCARHCAYRPIPEDNLQHQLLRLLFREVCLYDS